jgi:Domain of unknown function (DUF4350)
MSTATQGTQPTQQPQETAQDEAIANSIDPSAGQIWRRFRGPLLIVGVIVVGALVYSILAGRSTGGPMDPQSAQRTGARALAVLLQERGVEVQRVERFEDAIDKMGPDATLLVTTPDLLDRSRLGRLRHATYHRIVLFEPGEEALARFGTQSVYAAGDAMPKVREPGCELAAARRAGTVDVRGPMYRVPGGSEGTEVCYGDGTRGSVVELPGNPTVNMVGSPATFSNAELANEGNAALAMNLLGSKPRLVWYLPSLADTPQAGDPSDPTAQQAGIWSLLPPNVRFAAGATAVAALLLMIAAARRLGPVVPEALPVVVRASEAAEGRARLYRRFRASDRAAAALRQATRDRLRSVLGLPGNAEPAALIAAVSARTGKTAEEVAGLLGDRPPQDEGELVRLAADLDMLEQEVRRS